MKFLYCKKCGTILGVVDQKCDSITCCGEIMSELVPGTTEASLEKHIPEIKVEGNIVTVTVGSVLHPMIPEHYIEWIALKTKQGNQRKALKPGEAPVAKFALLDGDQIEAAFAYCNLHSLWKKEL